MAVTNSPRNLWRNFPNDLWKKILFKIFGEALNELIEREALNSNELINREIPHEILEEVPNGILDESPKEFMNNILKEILKESLEKLFLE